MGSINSSIKIDNHIHIANYTIMYIIICGYLLWIKNYTVEGRLEIFRICSYAVASYKSTSLVKCQTMFILHIKEVLLYPRLLTHYCIPVICLIVG